MSVDSHDSRRCCELMVKFMDVFVKELCMQESMNIIEGDIVNDTINDQFIDDTHKAGNVFSAIRDIIGCKSINKMQHSP